MVKNKKLPLKKGTNVEWKWMGHRVLLTISGDTHLVAPTCTNAPGTSAEQEYTVTNTGNADATMMTLSLSSPGQLLQKTANTCTTAGTGSGTLAPGATCIIRLKNVLENGGSSELRIDYDDQTGSTSESVYLSIDGGC